MAARAIGHRPCHILARQPTVGIGRISKLKSTLSRATGSSMACSTTNRRTIVGKIRLVADLDGAIQMVRRPLVTISISAIVGMTGQALAGAVMVGLDITVGIASGGCLVAQTHTCVELGSESSMTSGTSQGGRRHRITGILMPLALPCPAIAVTGRGGTGCR